WAMSPANYNLQLVLARLSNVRQWSAAVVSGELGEIGYVLIGGWVTEAAAAVEAIEALRHKEAIIVDVRPNSGGDERIAQQVPAASPIGPLTTRSRLRWTPRQE